VESATSPYRGETIHFATQHQKERVVRIPFAVKLGAVVVAWRGFDTDSLGTFTGEVDRPGSPREMAVRKALEAARSAPNGCGIGSEGSVGPDPRVPFLTSNEEFLAFVDTGRQITVVESLVHYRPVYHSIVVGPNDDISQFLQTAKFGSHGVTLTATVAGSERKGILRRRPQPALRVVKGLRCLEELEAARRDLHTIASDGTLRLSSDFRAHENPTRMRVIGRVARVLAIRLASPCPSCRAPGFGVVGWEAGLPCRVCGSASEVASHAIYGCEACSHRELRPRPDGKREIDPSACAFCNP
jgi:hypothetical protein